MFVSEAIVDYDKAVQAKAEDTVNTMSGNAASKQMQKGGASTTAKPQTGQETGMKCHLFNFEDSGCPNGDRCKFVHMCKKCGSKDHGFTKRKKTSEK